MKKEIKNNSFVFYATSLEMVETLEVDYPDMAAELLRSIIEYGIYGEYESKNPIIKSMMISIGFGIDKAKERYNNSVENGKKGGRPSIELNEEEVNQKKQELKTWKAVAAYYDITEQTLRTKRTEWEKAKNAKNPKNLNDNVNENENDNENDNENENVINFERVKEIKENALSYGVDREQLEAATSLEEKGRALGF